MIVMYGGPPIWPPPGLIPEGPVTTPIRPWEGGTLDWGKARLQTQPELEPVVLSPGPPEALPSLRSLLEARAAWLENELRMHDAWRLELAAIKAMLEAGLTAELPTDRREP